MAVRKVSEVHPDRPEAKGWCAQYRSVNGRRQHRHFSRKSDAEEAIASARMGRQRSRAGLVPEPQAMTLAEWADIFLAGYIVRPSTYATFNARLNHAVAAFGDRQLRDLKPSEIRAWVADLPLGGTGKGDALRTLRQVLKSAVLDGLIPENPAGSDRAKVPKASKVTVHPFSSWDEVREVAAHLRQKDAALVVFLCATGLRWPSEVLALEWQDVDVEARRVSVHKTVYEGEASEATKTSGSRRDVALSTLALEALESLRLLYPDAAPDDVVFPGERGRYMNPLAFRRDRWRYALEDAGLRHRRVYECRHTFASLALASGADLGWVSQQLGHASMTITLSTYARYLPKAHERALDFLDAAQGSGT
jgi:integrase